MNKYAPPESILPLLDQQPSIFRFRRALRRADQMALDHLLEQACGSIGQENPHACTLVELVLLAVILAEHKQIGRLAGLLSRLQG